MSILPKAVSRLIESFERLPGVGPKTATRLVFYLLHLPTEELSQFAQNIENLKSHTVLCSVCKNVAEGDPCTICSDPRRDHATICVVEQPTDVLSLEKTGSYKGVYHVLHGAIDPLNNIGPDEIYIADLLKRMTGGGDRVSEVILATNPNMEGEATAMYITKQLKDRNAKCKVTRLAHGLPVGADIEYADEVTLTRALEGRREY
ncbi:recombination protein RecR [Candidatus Gottesmanbacteria bacterium]|nr:recombination protein RecR [Candidatus Gottesmanbacteria bacterium]